MEKVRIEANGSLVIPQFDGHPNRIPFAGVLCRVDEASDDPPGGAQGHRVVIPMAVAAKALPTLVGMGVNFEPYTMARHEPRKKIGVITGSYIRGNEVVVEGSLWGVDFPKEVDQIKANRDSLGMSYEVDEAAIENPAAPIWKVLDFSFTGAAILLKNAAAYKTTQLAANAERRYPDLTLYVIRAQAVKFKLER